MSAVTRAGGVGVLDLGAGTGRVRSELAKLRDWSAGAWGVRITDETPSDPRLLAGADLVLADVEVLQRFPAAARPPRVFAEVVEVAGAHRAAAAGAAGLVLRGNEAGGRVSELSSFVLVQRLLAESNLELPLWVCGGIGPRTAAAVLASGATGVVLDIQLALLAEAEPSSATAARLRRLDGSESVYQDGRRFLPALSTGRPTADTGSAAAQRPARSDDGTGRAALPPGAVPIGQDGGLAESFAARYGDVGTAVRAVRSAAAEAALAPPASRITHADGAFGTRLPIAQGPMTRVSDQAGFAAAVAAHGALPFIALALADGAQSRAVLEQTRDALGDRPWGVGILGFVPDEVRAAQIDVIADIRPSHAIIAGGRPSQAAELEELGVRTFLHVPSPTLLTQYLGRGARRFVFEGAECGGHIGPRNSFPLWETQIDVLRSEIDAGRLRPADVAVLFAGGVHDARSAAMVAALAAPLTACGVEVGVLMGTAYLCTEEAVAHGAITPLFQRQVLAADRTELLETAPGHVTRALASPFTSEFDDLRRRLTAQGVPERQVWAELEALNVGRLRIAAKSTRHVETGVVSVDADEQLRDGLFMAGQAAVLRHRPTTIAELHRAVTSDAEGFRREQAAGRRARREPTSTPTPRPLDIAIVGMGCAFPEAPDLDRYWANIVAGRDSITEVPVERWDHTRLHRPDATAGDGTSPSKWGGFLPPIPFDALRHGIPPAALSSIDPAQLLALTVAEAALADAFGAREFDRGRTSVVFGVDSGGDLANANALRALLPSYLAELPAELDATLPRLTGDSFAGTLSNVVSGRIANRLDLGGTNYAVDAACASSLAALDVACKELIERTSDIVLCGGADVHNGIGDYLHFASVGALSRSGRCRSFDSAADGIVLGEGAACVVLKRLDDARRDGDRVYAVIKAVGSASDGRALGLTAPRAEGQQNALGRAYAQARMSPAEIGLVEAHGTGTVAGDAAELSALTNVFRSAGARIGGTALGSVKSQIGHTKCAAGLAGLVKTAMALHTGVLPPTLHVSTPNVAYDSATSPFVLSGRARPWPVAAAGRAAAVSAAGFGGINFHAVLRADEHGTPPASGGAQWPAELFLFAGADDASLSRALRLLRERLEVNDRAGRPWRLRDLAATTADLHERTGLPAAVALVATDLDALAVLLGRALAGEHDPAAGLFRARSRRHAENGDSAQPAGGHPGAAEFEFGAEPGDPAPSVALLFPGQGSQRPGMLAPLLMAFPELQRHLRGVPDVMGVVYPAPPRDQSSELAQRRAVTETTVAQQALGGTGLLVAELLERLGIHPDMVAGHSYGELVALCAAGVMTTDELVTVTRQRATSVSRAVQAEAGTMAAVSAGAAQTASVLDAAGLGDHVVVANHNSPTQVVVSGPVVAVQHAVAALRAAGLGAGHIPVAGAFHSPLMNAAGREFAAALHDREFQPAEVPVWSNRTAAPYPADPSAVRGELAAHLTSPVRFAEQIVAMYEAGARVFIEAGPGNVLTRLAAAILRGRPHLVVSCEDSRPGLPGFLDMLARLAIAGVGVRSDRLLSGRGATVLGQNGRSAGRTSRFGGGRVGQATGDTPPPRLGWVVDGRSVRTAQGHHLPGGLRPAQPIQEDVITMHRESDSPGEAERLVTDFLRSSRELLAAQRDVLMTYLGSGSTDRPSAPPVVGPATVARPALTVQAEPEPEPPAAAHQPPTQAIESTATTHSAPTSPELDTPAPHSASAEDAAPAEDEPVDIHAVVLAVISERTGYPIELIDPDLDLESDFSIDSIKRTEIAGELIARLGLDTAALPDDEVDQLAKARTTMAIAGWLTDRCGRPAAAPRSDTNGRPTTVEPEIEPAQTEPAGVVASRTNPVGREPVRHVWGAVELAALDDFEPSALAGTRFAVFGEPGAVRDALCGLLERHGSEVSVSSARQEFDDAAESSFDGVVRLDGLDAEDPVLPDLFGPIKSSLTRSLKWFAVLSHAEASGMAATASAAGLRGLIRTVAREYAETTVRLIEVDPAAAPDRVAVSVLTELLSERRTDPSVIRLDDTLRRAELPIRADLGLTATTGGGPGTEPAGEARMLGLDSDAVLLVIGGARGITARMAVELAAGGARVHVAGRTARATAPESQATLGITDLPGLRAALISAGATGSPADIDASARLILARREVEATMAELRGPASEADYHQLDVLDAEAVQQLVKELHTRYGRIDGVVFGAGTIEDRLLADTSVASLRRVYDTKVSGATALVSALSGLPHPPGFVVFFGSVAAVLGSRGQGAYSAANDALEVLGAGYARQSGARALTLHWGPWAPLGEHPGMVSDEVGRQYARLGLDLIDPEAGVRAMVRELLWGDPTVRSVLYTPQGWVNP
ncbi:type I polyketide synthase [Actinoalloteichus hymeniacidonis]|uniref:type I polyketide synthase n=1 Tax=Actinoalloteichus hymeniacidonis TaxID=340345 RepID=UPI001C12C0E2|nr:type I polyketide synthase [Actinoalloteichus hymeniacidonis]